MTTKTEAKAALADLMELAKSAPAPRWQGPFRTLMDFINNVPAAPDAPVYECIGKGGEYELLGPARAAGVLRDALMSERHFVDDSALNLTVYRDLKTGEVYVRHAPDFLARMRRIR